MNKRPRTFVVRLQALSPTDAVRELRVILKLLLRRHGFRCLSACEEEQPSNGEHFHER
jgi:hypothetical protein